MKMTLKLFKMEKIYGWLLKIFALAHTMKIDIYDVVDKVDNADFHTGQ